jgi:uncharacterized RDD family membrane protein YckC
MLDDQPPIHPPIQPQRETIAGQQNSRDQCPLCARKLSARWLKKPIPRNSINGVVVCAKCRNGFANRRQAAYLIDALLWLPVSAGIAYGVSSVAISVTNQTDPSAVNMGFLMVNIMVGWIVLPLIFTFKDSFAGKSPGRALCGVRVVDRDTLEPIGPLQSLQRNLILLFPYIGFVAVVLTMMKGTRWGDGWANTVVIWDKHRHKPPFDPRGILCLRCGYNLTGNVSGVCPECGCPISDT